MSVGTLILREIRHRLGTFALSVLAVAIAVGVVVASELLLLRDRLDTEAILAAQRATVEQTISEREAEVAKTGAALQDEIRKQMVKLGFNVLILPDSQDLSELHLNGTLSATMPESYVSRLAESNIVTVNHLLPMVTRRISWPEQSTEAVLVGTRGEVPILHRAEKKPILDAVAPGQMVVGYDLHQRLKLTEKQRVTMLGREFEVAKLHPQRGTVDDVTVWIDLAQAQELLGLQNLIHGILALECECAGDRISQVRAEIQQILPGTQVVERYSQALARAEARSQAARTAAESLAEAKASGAALLAQVAAGRQAIEAQHADLVRWLAPVVVIAASIWVGLLAWLNVRQRRAEIGILRAIGLSRLKLLAVFLAKAGTTGLAGGAIGLLAGAAVMAANGSAAQTPSLATPLELESPAAMRLLIIALLAAPLLSMVASWLPALAAAHQDPALVLEGE